MANEHFYPEIEPYRTGKLKVDDPHTHCFRNVRFQPDTLLLDRTDRLRSIPAFAVHGRYDLVCPVKNLHDLCGAWPELDATIVPDAGHSSHEPGITRELVAATDRIAETGSPVR